MHIDKFEEAMMNCRFCFMCRHLSTIGQVRCTEVDTPRVRAAMRINYSDDRAIVKEWEALLRAAKQ